MSDTLGQSPVVVPPVLKMIEEVSMAWEEWVPLDCREAMDAGVDDFLDFVNPVSWFTDEP